MGRSLILASITVEDFGQYGAPQTFRFGGQGAVALTGANGAGKSTGVAVALTWCLYGKGPPVKMGAATRAVSGAEVIRHGAREAKVIAVFDQGGDQVLVSRLRPRTGRERITVIRAGAEYHSQDAIDTLIGASYDVFVRTVVRGQDDPWAFAEATDARKREILDAITGAEKLTPALERAKAARHRLEAEASHLEGRKVDTVRRIGQLQPDEVEAAAAGWDVAHRQKVTEAWAEVAALEAALEEARALDREIEGLRGQRLQLEQQRPVLDLGPYAAAVEAYRRDFHGKATQLALARAQVEATAGLKVGTACPTCGQTVTLQAPVVAMHHANVDRVGPLEAAAQQAQGELDHAVAVQRQATDWLGDQVREWEAQLQALPAYGMARVPAAEQALALARRRAAELEQVENPHRNTAQRLRLQRDHLLREVAHLEAAAQQARHEAVIFQAWEETLAPKGVRAHLADGTLAAIETEASRWLDVLSRGRLRIRFAPTKETAKGATRETIVTLVEAVSKQGIAERDLLTFSGGERARINFAVDLGVAAVFARGGALALSLLVVDEENLSGLDGEGKAQVALALAQAGVADVVVIDHDPTLAATLPRRLQVTRGPDDCSIVEEV